MARHTEPAVNNSLGTLLQGMLPRSHVRSENTQAIVGHSGLRPDILITAPGRSPVVIEAEYLPAATAEVEAKERLGLDVTEDGRRIEAVIALRYPIDMGDADDLRAALTESRISWCVFTEESAGVTRFPESGWLDGSVGDLADLVRLVSVPQRAVDEAATTLQEGIDAAAKVLDELNTTRSGITMAIARLLGMTDVPQTRRMACAIIANAMIFHERIAGMHPTVRPLGLVCGDGIPNPQGEMLAAWTDILAIDYWAIFAIAKDVLEQLPSADAARILRRLRNTAQAVNSAGVDNAHDLTGRIFQRLIADRKYLATFYTLPASAALLARLAVARMDGVDWSDAEAIGKLRVADFACGTGALLSAVYDQIAARHERDGANSADLHRVMLEEVLYGCDVMPSAIHITGATLSGIEPSVDFGNSRLYTLPYGRQSDGTVKIGSLELMQTEQTMALFHTSDPGKRTGSTGEETAEQIVAEFPDEGFDLVIMNPPFTRAGSDWEGSGRQQDYVKQFRGLSTDLETQHAMATLMKQLAKDTCYHGYAGIASAFAALGHGKLKPGGVLALVLPLSAAVGVSWQKFRQLLARHYTELNVLSVAAADNDQLSFSSDTGMAECLVVARKLKPGEISEKRVQFTSLSKRPQGFASAAAIARNIVECDYPRRIEDGPYDGTPQTLGDEVVSKSLTTPNPADDDGWAGVRLWDYSLAQTAYELCNSRLWLPGTPAPSEINAVPLNLVGTRGFYDMNIAGTSHSAPFSKVAPSPTATYPSLWNHDATKETRMVCAADSQMQVKSGMEAKAAAVWATASRAHVSRDFRFNSQPLAAAFTEQESIGGRAWPNVVFGDTQFDYAFAIWGNCTLGMLSYWWHANRQVAGRGTITIGSLESLPVLDFRTLNDDQLAMAELIFNEFRDKELQPAYLADADPNRALLDHSVVCDLLGFDEDTYMGVRRLAAKWCAEPSVHGGKQRPKGAKFVA